MIAYSQTSWNTKNPVVSGILQTAGLFISQPFENKQFMFECVGLVTMNGNPYTSKKSYKSLVSGNFGKSSGFGAEKRRNPLQISLEILMRIQTVLNSQVAYYKQLTKVYFNVKMVGTPAALREGRTETLENNN